MSQDLAELFARDPLTYTKGPSGSPHDGPEVVAIVERYRQSRGQFALGNQTAGKAPAKPRSAAAKASAGLDLKLDLSALKKKA